MNDHFKILILGLGNEILTDDGIGVHLVKDLQRQLVNYNIDFKELNVGGLEILEELDGYNIAIIIDGIQTKNGKPSSVYHFKRYNFHETLHLTSFHNVSFRTRDKINNQLGIQLPSDIQIIAIEIIENRIFSREFSKIIKSNYPEIRAKVKGLVEKLLKDSLEQKRKAFQGNWL